MCVTWAWIYYWVKCKVYAMGVQLKCILRSDLFFNVVEHQWDKLVQFNFIFYNTFNSG